MDSVAALLSQVVEYLLVGHLKWIDIEREQYPLPNQMADELRGAGMVAAWDWWTHNQHHHQCQPYSSLPPDDPLLGPLREKVDKAMTAVRREAKLESRDLPRSISSDDLLALTDNDLDLSF